LDVEPYPLTLHIGAGGLGRGVTKLEEQLGAYITNRDPGKMSVVVMTGVTALTRATAMRMDLNGVSYPAEDIRPWLVGADITHISNEVSFAENCPPPGDYYTMVFCSDPSYFELLEELDIDVVELTGNHLLDWGLDAMKLSLIMYDTRDIPYYGGGWNLAQAQTPLTIAHGVHTFGFVGCNPAGPVSDWATDQLPGSAPCNFGRVAEQLAPQIRGLREQGAIPIVTLQYLETYSYEPTGQQRIDFRELVEAGAVIVSGSQAHQPQGFDFVDGTFIHYGLGNLFFDQMQSLETRQEFIDRHVFYDGRHISTEVQTAILEDYARPRPMTAAERETLLRATFAASGW
jgi:poly-gamma-glutamate synthesis protein (capsule biosynthesis protein)